MISVLRFYLASVTIIHRFLHRFLLFIFIDRIFRPRPVMAVAAVTRLRATRAANASITRRVWPRHYRAHVAGAMHSFRRASRGPGLTTSFIRMY